MPDPQGFLRYERALPARRPVPVRIKDWREVYPSADEPLIREQATRCMDCGVPFCHSGCPLGNRIPDWNDLVRTGQWAQAIEQLHATNNFPEFTGRLCPAPCEAACVLAIDGGEAVTIKQIEVEIVNRAFDAGLVTPQSAPERSGKRVAVVGSGPAGLAAAQQLARAGHAVTVYERDSAPPLNTSTAGENVTPVDCGVTVTLVGAAADSVIVCDALVAPSCVSVGYDAGGDTTPKQMKLPGNGVTKRFASVPLVL